MRAAALLAKSAQRESRIQRGVRMVFEATGARVYSTATVQTRHTTVTPGTPDLLVFHRKFGVCFFEVKASGGRVRPAQQVFADCCEALQTDHRRSIHYVRGGLQECYTFLWAQGVLAGGKTLADVEVDA